LACSPKSRIFGQIFKVFLAKPVCGAKKRLHLRAFRLLVREKASNGNAEELCESLQIICRRPVRPRLPPRNGVCGFLQELRQFLLAQPNPTAGLPKVPDSLTDEAVQVVSDIS